MTLPAVLSTRTVTQTYTDLLGSPSQGKVTFTPVAVAEVDGQIITLVPVIVTLDNSGSISAVLPVGTDVDLSSPLYISVTESFATSTNQLGQAVGSVSRSYVVQVPDGAGSVVLSSLPEVVPTSPYYTTAADFAAAVDASVAAAASASASAASAALSASLVGAPADSAVAAIVGNPASATSVSLSSTYGTLTAAATEVTNRQNADSAHVAAADPHGDRAYASGLAGVPTPATAAQRYNGNGFATSGVRTTGTVLNTLVVGAPIYSGDAPLSIASLDVLITTLGAAGAVYRMGAWSVIDQAHPYQWASGTPYGTLLAQAVAAATAAATVVAALAPLVIPARTWFVLGGVSQVAIAQPTIGNATIGGATNGYGGTNANNGVSTSLGWLKATGSSGVLGDFTPDAGLSNIGHGVGFLLSP